MRTLAIASVLTLVASNAAAGVVGIDARSLSPQTGWNPATDARYAMFRAAFTNAGHTLQSVSSFHAVDLAGLDLLVLFHPTSTGVAYTPSEATDIRAFVAGGGALFVVGDGGWSTSSTVGAMNSILQPHGLTLGSSIFNGSGALLTGFLPHALTDGVTTIGVDYHRFLTVSGGAIDLQSGPDDIVAASEVGGGRVVAIGDASSLSNPGFGGDYDLSSADNLKFLENAIDWLLLPFGDGCPGAGGFVPELTATSYAPAAGTQLGLSVKQGLGGAPATFFFGLGQAELPMAGGCTLNISPLLPVAFTVPLGGAGAGNGTITLAGVLPNDMSGVTFSMQTFVTDGSVPHGFSNSNEIVIAVQ